MRHRWLLMPLLLLAASPLAAQEGQGARDSTRISPRAFGAPRPDAGLRLGPTAVEASFAIELPEAPRLEGLWSRRRFADRAAEWAAGVRARALRERAGWFGRRPAPAAADSAVAHKAAGRSDLLPGALDDFADLGIRISGRGELGGAWTRFRPCDPALRHNCNPSFFPLLKPEVQFGVLVDGTISDRIHLDVDYDQRREFDAANNINVYYQGLPGEVLQRVELGDVSIRLPASRYLTEGIPGGNFGFKATGELGPLDVQAVWAQQKGDVSTREFRLGGARGPEALVQDARVVVDDADHVQGQFFFLVDPARIAGHPHVDALGVRAADAPASLRPAQGGSIQLYRDERPSFANPQQQAQLGYFLAQGVAADGRLRHSGQFRRLVPGEDYIAHSSGLWIMLRSPLRSDEALAVSYATETGAVVGTVDAERSPAGTTPTLFLLRGPATIHQPGQPTWPYEMHQVYRLDSSSGVEPGSIELKVSLGELAAGITYKDVGGRSLSFLKLFGMDEDAPAERLDEAQVFQPARGGFLDGGGEARFGGTYVVFPTLQPFAEPPPVPSAGLSAAEAAAALGGDANPAIYQDPDPVLRDGRARFRLNFDYRVRLEGLASSFNLGAFGIREGSEKVTVDGRVLQRGVDYTIDYDLGQVTLTNAQALFGASPNAEIKATWEQKAAFQIAPKTLFGLNARYGLGSTGELNVVGLYQAEKSLVRRPQLGLEPASVLLGGASGKLDFGAAWLDRALDYVPGLAGSAASRIRLSGELALSLPDPNRRGDTFLDDFEASDEIPLGLDRSLWRLGSRPEDPSGAESVLPFPLDPSSAARLVWQHDISAPDGRVVGPLLAREIDRQINVAGAQRTEPVLYLTLGDAGTPPAERRWRSMTTVLETTGRDMTRSEFLELYASAAPGQELALVFDIGTVSEDAFYIDGAGRTGGAYPNGRRWGAGVLDEEARTAEREIWGPALDTLGLWDQRCRAQPGTQSYPLGDARANCTRGNGLVDTEDLDGNGILDGSDGAHFRYVVRLDGSSPYLVRDRSATGTDFALYRIPLRGAGAIPVGGATEGAWRFVKHLRLTVAGRAGSGTGADVVLARMRVIGSRWAKRDLHGVLSGMAGDLPGRGAATTRFQVGPVSRITDGGEYAPPPGVSDQLQDPTSVFGGSAVEYNEKSLRLAYQGLEGGDRVEAYYRYPQQPRNFLAYRELRFWAVPRGGRWGSADGERLVVSVGTDPRNRYLFQAPLRPAAGGAVRPEHWLPEVVLDFERWFELKARAEQALIEGTRTPGEPVVVWSADSAYAVVLEDRARAPNLAAVRELAFAVYNAGGAPGEGELWIDELRLGGKVTDPGVAGHWELDVSAGDFATATLSYANRGALFRPMDGEAGYQAANDLSVGGTAQLGRLAPAGWGLEAPVTISHARTGLEPTFLERSDVRADRLPGLRETGAERTRVGLSLRKATPTAHPWLGLLLDGAQLRLGYQTASTSAITSGDEASGFDGSLSYHRRPAARELDLTPPFVEDVLRALAPQSLEESPLFERVASARLRWSPETVSFTGSYASQQSRTFRYSTILASAADRAAPPIDSPREGVETSVGVSFRPLESLTAGLSLASTRDLLPAERSSTRAEEREAIAAARGRLAGLDVGWETNRMLTSRVEFRPTVTPWLRPGFTYTARFRTDRSPSYWEARSVGDDTTAVLQRTFQGDRQVTRSLLLDPAGLTRAAGADSAGTGGILRALLGLGRALEPIDLSWSRAVGSRFERAVLDPALGYQLGLGGPGRFRVIEGDTAATATARSGFRASGGLRLPWRTGLEVAYGEQESEHIEFRGGRRAGEERTWPDLRLSWAELPIPAFMQGAIVHGSLSLGYQRSARSSIFGGPAGQERASEETSVPLHFTLGLASGLSGSYTGALSRGLGSDPTGRTEQEGAQHAVQVAGSFIAPLPLRETFPGPIQASLRYSYQAQEQCRLGAGAPAAGACVPFVDLIHRQFSLMLDTFISQLNVGFHMSYNDRQSFVGTRSGSSQFQLGLFGEFNFSAGTFAGGVR